MKKTLAALICASTLMGGAMADEIVRTPAPGNFPISTVVEVPSTVKTYYLSGVVPAKQEDGTFGNTEAQTVSVLKGIEAQLKAKGLEMSDIVKMQAFLVATPETGKMDFDGFMKGYNQYFGTEAQPNTPARSTFEIKALYLPEWFVEIEVIAVK